MTVSQLILSFKLKLDKIDSQAYPDILDQEIRFWLDEGADRFLKQRYERKVKTTKLIMPGFRV